jgi:class 3 adenylate cyclase
MIETYANQILGKILVVDDTLMNIELIDGLLTPHGYRVEGVQSGAEALNQLSLDIPDLILLDVMMPGMNGYEVCRHIREKKELSYIPILFITASEVEQKDVIEGLEAGGNDYIRRPFDAAELLSRINANIRLKRVYDELARTKAELSRYVSLSTVKMVEEMTSGQTQPSDRVAEVTILFSDIRDFSQISENMSPEEVFRKLNRNLKKQIRVIEKYGGIIDKLSGDAIMAVFEGPNMADDAVRCARDIVHELSLAETRHELEWAYVGIGINTGPIYLGSLGSEFFRDYTVVGNTVNIAARLCDMAEKFQVLFTESTFKSMDSDQFQFQEMGEQALKGFHSPTKIFQLL